MTTLEETRWEEAKSEISAGVHGQCLKDKAQHKALGRTLFTTFQDQTRKDHIQIRLQRDISDVHYCKCHTQTLETESVKLNKIFVTGSMTKYVKFLEIISFPDGCVQRVTCDF